MPAPSSPDAKAPRPPLTARRPGLSLAAFPAFIFSFMPDVVHTRLAPGTSGRRVLSLAWPSVAEQALVTLIGLVDVYIVGHLGASALAGVGLGGQVLNLVAAIFGALGVGATALVARHVGAREPDEARRLAQQAVLLALSLGLLAAAIAYLFAEPIVRLLGAAPDVVIIGANWLRPVAPSFACIGLLLVGNAALRGAGDTRSPLIVMIVVNLINVSLAWSLTRGLFGLPQLGVFGVALATAIGQTAGGLLVLYFLLRGRALRLPLRLPGPDTGRLRRLLNIGLPAGLEQVLLQVALLSLAVIINQLGTAAYAAHQVGLRISSLSWLPGWGFSIAATTLVGQALGARNPDGARHYAYSALRWSLLLMSLMGAFLFVFARPLIGVFSDDPNVLAAGTIIIRTAALAQPIMATSFSFGGALRGAGDTRTTMLITASSIWGLRLGASYVLAIVLGLGVSGVWLGIALDFAVRSFLFWRRFESGRWATLRV